MTEKVVMNPKKVKVSSEFSLDEYREKFYFDFELEPEDLLKFWEKLLTEEKIHCRLIVKGQKHKESIRTLIS